MHQTQPTYEVPSDRLKDALTYGSARFGRSGLFAAALAVLVFASPNGVGVKADIVGPLNEGVIAEDIDQNAACQEMLAVTDELAGENNSNNTTACGPAPQFSVESNSPNETLDVTHTNLNNGNIVDEGGGVDVPTGARPSPLFGAVPFSMKMLREEEFGPVKLSDRNAKPTSGIAFPRPTGPNSGPGGQSLDEFLSFYIKPPHEYPEPDAGAYPYPWPMGYSNDPDDPAYIAEATAEYGTPPTLASMTNAWQTDIEGFLGRTLNTPPAEGRPPGIDWAHQRWEEFYPQVYFNTAQAGARTNSGLRDRLQSHNYVSGEWGPLGLYHFITGLDGDPTESIVGTTGGIPARFHPKFPEQQPNALWTWDGTFPPKLLRARYGEPILMRHYNALPINPAANFGFGIHTLTTHEHNGHNPAESDGYTQAFFFPGQYYDYHWPMIAAGHDSINTDATDPRAATPCRSGQTLVVLGEVKTCDEATGTIMIPGDYREIMSTHWFHDHMLDFTAQNVYKGNATMFNYYSAIDRGQEARCHYENPYNETTKQGNVNLCLPSGTELAWGNRDYDINLMLSDKAWDSNGQLFFNIFNKDGFLGDQLLTNLTWKPHFDVRARRYRFRILNASVSRYMRLALVEQVQGNGGELSGPPGSGISYNRVPFHMVANDGNILEHAVHFDGNKTVAGFTNRKGILPTQAIAERYDIVVDFAPFAPGTKLYMVNLLEHRNGRRPHEAIPLQEVLNGEYHERNNPTADNADIPVPDGNRYDTDPTVSRFLEFRVHPYIDLVTGEPAEDKSMNPALYEEGGMKMMPRPTFTQEELANAVHRRFEFARSNGTDESPWTIKTDGGAGYNMDPRRLSAAPTKDGQVEIWHLEGNGGWSHPIHVHFEEGQILSRDGAPPPEWEKWARKDVYRIGRMEDSTHSVTFAIRFREFLGTYMEHCHNTQHEDHAMLLRWDIENPNQVKIMPTPMPTWDGVGYVGSTALPTARRNSNPGPGDGDGGDPPDEPVNIGPSVTLTPQNPSGDAPYTPTFTAEAGDTDGHIVFVDWDFGNGNTSEGSETNILKSPTYTAAGTYTVTVTVTDDAGETSTDSTVVTVSEPEPDPVNIPPLVDLTPDNPTGVAPYEVTFNANASDPDGDIDTIEWSFGDGETGSGQSVTHTFDAAGTYQVKVTVTDDEGAEVTDETTVVVSDPVPQDPENILPTVSLDYPHNPTGEAPFKVAFGATAHDEDGEIVLIKWVFGDGDIVKGTDQVSHTYQEPGVYKARVVVKDDKGARAVARTTVTVTEPADQPAVDTLRITRADYKLIRVRLKASGEQVFVGKYIVRTKSSVAEGQTLNVYLGDPSHNVLLGSGPVNDRGVLVVRKRMRTPTLPKEGTYVTVVSELGGEKTRQVTIITDGVDFHTASN